MRIADVGQGEIEEIDAVGPTAEHAAGWGANFGWSGFEGNNRFNDDVADPGNLVFPVLHVHARRGLLGLRRRDRHDVHRVDTTPRRNAT